ncbi:helix-turn-helix domain-containing protein [Tannockella kyphosi]|uniref:helix-turn-helix domain-containing protein n=1 Tax=Tannockella kyphosi TaxID=2899121 RepID=UPI002010E99D|nr:helix-turn-helix transcriptional regulator [Tannockella kyphosi]
MELKDVMKLKMQQLNLNNQQLAKRANLNPSTISRYLTGEISSIRGDKLRKVADALECDVRELTGGHVSDEYLGDYQENINYLSDRPELASLYNDIVDNENLKLLFDKSRTLSPSDLEKVLVIINTFIKEDNQ